MEEETENSEVPPVEVKEKEEEEEEEELSLEDNLKYVYGVSLLEGDLETPIDINLTYTKRIKLPPLFFVYYEIITKKVKLKNNGRTMTLNCTWPAKQPVPYLIGGPLMEKYEFSQLHFHWGETDMEGSEHTVDGVRMPLEMHVVHFKSSYFTHEKAVKEKDGIVIVVYLFRLQAGINPAIQILIDSLESIEQPDTHIRLENFPLSFMVKQFNIDYFLYFGTITTSTSNHNVTWIVSRQMMEVTAEQIDQFRYLFNINDEPMVRNFRPVPLEVSPRTVFHVCPSTVLYSTLLMHAPPEDEYVKPVLILPEEDEEAEVEYEEEYEEGMGEKDEYLATNASTNELSSPPRTTE